MRKTTEMPNKSSQLSWLLSALNHRSHGRRTRTVSTVSAESAVVTYFHLRDIKNTRNKYQGQAFAAIGAGMQGTVANQSLAMRPGESSETPARVVVVIVVLAIETEAAVGAGILIPRAPIQV